MEKKMENDMETRIIMGYIRVIFLVTLGAKENGK